MPAERGLVWCPAVGGTKAPTCEGTQHLARRVAFELARTNDAEVLEGDEASVERSIEKSVEQDSIRWICASLLVLSPRDDVARHVQLRDVEPGDRTSPVVRTEELLAEEALMPTLTTSDDDFRVAARKHERIFNDLRRPLDTERIDGRVHLVTERLWICFVLSPKCAIGRARARQTTSPCCTKSGPGICAGYE